MDKISIPKSIPTGTYRIYAKFSDYGSLSEEVVASFKVTKSADIVQNYLIIIIGILGVIAGFVVVNLFILTKRRNI